MRGVFLKTEMISFTVFVWKVSLFNSTFFSVFRNSPYRNQSENPERESGEWLCPSNGY